MNAVGTLTDVPLDEAPPTPEEWIDLTTIAVGLNVLSRGGEIALVVQMPDGYEHIGFSFDPDGAEALAEALYESADRAAELAAANN